MSMKDKIKNFFYLDEEDHEETNAPVAKQTVHQEPAPSVSVQSQLKRTSKERRPKMTEQQTTPNVVSLQNLQKSSKVILIEPRVYAEAQDIAEHLKTKRAVVVNLQRIDKEQGIRIIDFLSGTVYALGGDIQRIGTDIFLCTPDNVEVSGAISDYFYEE